MTNLPFSVCIRAQWSVRWRLLVESSLGPELCVVVCDQKVYASRRESHTQRLFIKEAALKALRSCGPGCRQPGCGIATAHLLPLALVDLHQRRHDQRALARHNYCDAERPTSTASQAYSCVRVGTPVA